MSNGTPPPNSPGGGGNGNQPGGLIGAAGVVPTNIAKLNLQTMGSGNVVVTGNLTVTGSIIAGTGVGSAHAKGRIRCPMCSEMGDPGLSVGNNELLGCSRCTEDIFREVANIAMTQRNLPDTFTVIFKDHVRKVNVWPCWTFQQPARVQTNDGTFWDIPFMVSGVDDRNFGKMPVCNHCSHQLACLTGISVHDETRWHLVLKRDTLGLDLV